MKRTTAATLAISLLLAGCGGAGSTDTSQGAMPIAPISLPLAPASQPKQARR